MRDKDKIYEWGYYDSEADNYVRISEDWKGRPVSDKQQWRINKIRQDYPDVPLFTGKTCGEASKYIERYIKGADFVGQQRANERDCKMDITDILNRLRDDYDITSYDDFDSLPLKQQAFLANNDLLPPVWAEKWRNSLSADQIDELLD